MERDISSFTCPNAAAGARVYEGVFTSVVPAPLVFSHVNLTSVA